MGDKRDIKADINLLANTMDSINQAKDFQVISEIIFKFIKKFISFDMSVIYKLNENDNSLEVVSCLGSNAEKMKKRSPFRIGEGAIGLVAKDKKSILINDVLISKEIKVRQFYEEDPIIRSFMSIPLIVGDKIIGILSVSCSRPHEYTQYDMQLISIIASQGAAFLELNEYISEIEKMSDQILEKVNSGVMVIDYNYKVAVFNDAAEKITGYSVEEIIGKNLLDIPIETQDNHWHILQSMKKLKIFNEEKTGIIRKSGECINIRLSTSLLYNDDNSVKSCICVFRDVTELEKLQKQVYLADKLSALGRITAGITHEIRNPLLPIRNASEYLVGKFKDEDKSEDIIKLLNIIIEESERLNRFLGQLSSLSKDNIIKNAMCDFHGVLDNILLLLKYHLGSNNINLRIDIVDKKIILPCSEDNLRQILLNLILNSIDAFNMNCHNKEKEIKINGTIENEDFILSIEDTGRGISKSDLNNIFDPFYTTKDNGTGLGLPLSLNIVETIGGKFSVHSTLGVGTKILLTLPTTSERMS